MNRTGNGFRRNAYAVVLACTMVATITTKTLAQTGAQTGAQPATTAQSQRATATIERPARAAGEVTTEEMMQVIRRLEDRVKELEAKLANPETASASSAPPVKAAAETRARVSDDKAKPDEAKAQEEKENAGIMSFFRKTEISGFVDAYYGYNFNRPAGDTAQLRNFDTKHNQFALNLVELALEKKATPDSRLGYRMDLDFGPATELVHASEPGGSETFNHLQQGYLSYLAPVGKGLQIDVGKFVTPNGAEVIETKDNWNYSRSLLFALAIPYYHFGVRATVPFNDKVTLGGMVVNGWNNVVDNNSGKSWCVDLTLKPTSKLTLVQNVMG